MPAQRPRPDGDATTGARPAADNEPPTLAAILLRHGTEKYPDAEERLDRLLRPLEGSCTVRRLLVDNALPDDAEPADTSESWRIIPGDNSVWEFSGFEKGISTAQRAWDPAAFLLVTDAFEAQPDPFDGLLSGPVIHAAVREGAVMGIGDRRRQTFAFDGDEFSTWLRSSFLLIPRQVWGDLGPLITFRDLDGLVPDEFTKQWRQRPSDRFSRAYWKMLVEWLTTLWHSPFTPDRDSYPHFRDKLRSLLNEHLLTLRLRRLGIPLVDLRYANKVSPDRAVASRVDMNEQIWALLSRRDRIRDRVPPRVLRFIRRFRQ